MGIQRNIGPYKPFAEIGRGALTTVYKAYQESLGRVVLLKVLHPDLTSEPDILSGFEKEALILAKLQHPNIVTIYDFGQDDGHWFFATEFVDGPNLSQLLESGRLPVGVGLHIGAEIAKALVSAHHHGLLHRDVKPANVFISNSGIVKLGDFGLASVATSPGGNKNAFTGTLGYVAPEVLQGAAPSRSSDIFGLGATIFECLAGRPAFIGTTESETITATLRDDPLPFVNHVPGVKGEIGDIVRHALAKDPENRFGNAATLLDRLKLTGSVAVASDLAKILSAGDEGVAETEISEAVVVPSRPAKLIVTDRPVKPPSRLRMPLAAAAVLTLLLVAVTGWQLMEMRGEGLTLAADKVAPDSLSGIDSLAIHDSESIDIQTPKVGTPTLSKDEAPIVVVDDKDPVQDPPPGAETLPPMTSASGMLEATTDLASSMYINGDLVGATHDNQLIELPVGIHVVAFRRPGFPESSHTIVIYDDAKTFLQASLWDTVMRLHVAANPWGELYVDGVLRDTIPPQDNPVILAPGKHVVTLSHPTLGMRREEIISVPGRSDTLRFDLLRSPDF